MTTTWPVTRAGSIGENVRTVQYLLTDHGHPVTVDGVFGSQTKAAVEAFQTAHGLAVDGVVGDETWPLLIVQVAAGSTGDAVRAVQSQIHSRGNGSVIAVDGIFGTQTSDAVGAFQQLLGLSVDKIVGPATWNHYVNGYLSARDTVVAAARVFEAWAKQDQQAALLDATPTAVAELFSSTFSPADAWRFDHAEGAAGTIYYIWLGTGKTLRIGVEDGTGGVYYAVVAVEFA
jgi:murein L,D-transpeptidase YcbB/YkuD